jgi:hypothetical protein
VSNPSPKFAAGSPIRFLTYGIIGVALAATLAMNAHVIASIVRARTNVPWWDGWAMIRDLMFYEQGQRLGPFLWPSYWGHRLVVLRLLMLADERWASLTSLTYLTLAIQLTHIGLLVALAFRILVSRARNSHSQWGGRPRPRRTPWSDSANAPETEADEGFGRGPGGPPHISNSSGQGFARWLVAATIILNLALSPFQMQNFVWSNQIMYVIVYAAATASVVVLVFSKGRWLMLALSTALGLISSFAMANGILIWPVLFALAAYLGFKLPVRIVLGVVGALVIASYAWNYQRPSMGMGFTGIIRDPGHAVMLVGLLLAGPITLISTPIGIAVAFLAAAAAGFLAVFVLRHRSGAPRELTALIACSLFLLLTLFSMVIGRLDASYLHKPDPMGVLDRYFTAVGLFWASIAPLVLYACWQQTRRLWLLAFYGTVFFALMFGGRARQYVAAEDWSDFFVGLDAVGEAFLLDVRDPQLMPILWPVESELETYVVFLRQRRLAFFSEPSASWPGKNIAEMFPRSLDSQCSGAIEKIERTGPGAWRVQGWAVDRDRGTAPKQILFTDAAGRIVGLARGGFRHNYFPGLMVEPASRPLSLLHAKFQRSEWLGYVRSAEKPDVKIYGMLSGTTVCPVKTDVVLKP